MWLRRVGGCFYGLYGVYVSAAAFWRGELLNFVVVLLAGYDFGDYG